MSHELLTLLFNTSVPFPCTQTKLRKRHQNVVKTHPCHTGIHKAVCGTPVGDGACETIDTKVLDDDYIDEDGACNRVGRIDCVGRSNRREGHYSDAGTTLYKTHDV